MSALDALYGPVRIETMIHVACVKVSRCFGPPRCYAYYLKYLYELLKNCYCPLLRERKKSLELRVQLKLVASETCARSITAKFSESCKSRDLNLHDFIERNNPYREALYLFSANALFLLFKVSCPESWQPPFVSLISLLIHPPFFARYKIWFLVLIVQHNSYLRKPLCFIDIICGRT